MRITFLGTSAMVPTKERNHAAVLLEYKGDNILFDCGEGVQRQFAIGGFKITKVTKLLITHFHGDHCLGIPGLLQSLAQNAVDTTLEIYGPVGTTGFLEHMFQSMHWETRIPLKITEVKQGIIFKGEEFSIGCESLRHAVPCVGFSFLEHNRRRINTEVTQKLGIPDGPLLGKLQEGETIVWKGKKVLADDVTYMVKGKKIVYLTDTGICDGAYNLAHDADLMISDATLTSEHKEKADQRMHLTAEDAALIASKAGVKKLILTHFSSRYKNTLEVEEDARKVFDNVLCAKDFMHVDL